MLRGLVGVEIERKYIIERPCLSDMERCEGYFASEIVQIYLASDKGTTRRIRKRTSEGVSRFYETEKVRIDEMSVTETEREISEDEFLALLGEQEPKTKPIIKTRHAFRFSGISYEIDVYPEWKSTAILENELEKRDTVVEHPSFIRILREVTGIREYSNAAMAKSFPPEDHL